MIIDIDEKSGFCFGVVNAIKRAEEEIERKGYLYSLGDIVHNRIELDRLAGKGLKTVSHSDIPSLRGDVLFIRAHGEPPATYRMARNNGVTVIDATCPVVSKLQKSVVEADGIMRPINGQVVILGKHGHAEVVGLNGQIENRGIIVEDVKELLETVDFSRPVFLLSQTTKPLSLFNEVAEVIREKVKEAGQPEENVIIKDTICRNVSNRGPHLQDFARHYDVILFISGKESSNGAVLYEQCRIANPRSYKIEDERDINTEWLEGASNIGICGATSTPRWLMERVREHLSNNIKM